jgi:hypothetical protein
LPSGNYDLPLVIQDRTFDAGNQLIYFARHMGFLGDQILVNGQPNANRTVENVPHRLRILNGSNSRIYKLAWADGTPLTVIATDGGLLDTAVSRNYVTLSPGERVELWVDFGQWAAGSMVELRSLAFSGGNFGGGGGMLPNGAEFPVMTFQVSGSDATPTPTPNPNLTPKAYLPVVLNQQQDSGAARLASVSQDVTRSFSLYMQQGRWTINGRTFEMTAVANDEIVTLDDREIWEFDNNSPFGGGGMMMGQPHPMHIHSLQFRVLSRIPPSNSTQYNNWLTVKDGYVDDGWKDTVLLMPGEKVQVDVTFKDYTGLFLYHCHNLEHEDMGMMRNFEVRV